jgi:uncharacterized peroxidase-related enzyme
VVGGELPADPRLRALAEFAHKLTREPAAIERGDVDELRSHAFDDAAIHDAMQVIAYFNYVNRIADAVGIEDEPDWR